MIGKSGNMNILLVMMIICSSNLITRVSKQLPYLPWNKITFEKLEMTSKNNKTDTQMVRKLH